MTERPLNILLVEDDEVDVMNVRRAFERNRLTNSLFVAGYRVSSSPFQLARPSKVPIHSVPSRETSRL